MKNKIKFPEISVSILTSDLCQIKNTIEKLEKCKIKVLHLDIMDGNFVPNLTFGIPVVKCIRSHTKLFLDVHLMISNPEKSFHNYIDAGADILTFHYESLSSQKIKKLISMIKNRNILCGISIKPATEVEKIKKYLDEIDMVLVMTVEPGFGGQKIINNCIEKISQLYNYREKYNLNYIISADGGINEKNLADIVKAGCDLPVVGNAIFSSKNIKYKINLLKSLI